MSHSQALFLDPLSVQDFHAGFWEKKPLHIERSENVFEPIIDTVDIESVLSTRSLYFPGVQLTQSGKSIDVGGYVDDSDEIIPLRLLELHRQGATIVLSQAQKLFAPLMDLCREATRTLKMNAQTNVYLSPPGNQGFNAHYDTHDVFILQVAGAKTFNFYPSAVRLPCPDEQFDADKLSSTRVDESIRLTAGDTLYIPRGVVHDAVADNVEASIHVTLGVFPVIVRDVLQRLLHQHAREDHRFRESVDPFGSSVSSIGDLQKHLAVLLDDVRDDLQNPVALADVMHGLCEELSLNALQDCRGSFSAASTVANDSGTTEQVRRIRLREEMVIHRELSAANPRIYSFGQILEFDPSFRDIIAKLFDNGGLSDADFSSLSPDQRDALLLRLRQENLVEVI